MVLLILQEDAHHLLPEPSMTPSPWKRTPASLEKCSHVLGFLGSQSSGSAGATIVPLICVITEEDEDELVEMTKS